LVAFFGHGGADSHTVLDVLDRNGKTISAPCQCRDEYGVVRGLAEGLPEALDRGIETGPWGWHTGLAEDELPLD
jgi:hypothetical protein